MLRKMAAETDIATALKTVKCLVKEAAQRRAPELRSVEPRLVAVSKTKPKSLIIEAYDAGQRHFGENYVQELVDKSKDSEILECCPDIRWHFIGNLQSNKVGKVAAVPGLWMIETISSSKLADVVNKAWGKLLKEHPLRVMLQVNTSQEESKGGVEPAGAPGLAVKIREECPNLNLTGLMTIGAFDHSYAQGDNPDFQCLLKVREEVCSILSIPLMEMELSMGMSHDYQHAIEVGSTNVRVGSTIFGARERKP